MKRTVTVGAILLALLTGCSGGGAEPEEAVISDVYRKSIDGALAHAPSDLEIAILSDYVVTDEEYAQAREAFVACMASSEYGFSVSLQPTQTSVQMPDGFTEAMGGREAAEAEFGRVYAECESHTTDPIEYVYLGMRDNPEGLSNTELIRRCFERHGIEDGKDLPDDEFSAMIFDNDNYLTANPDSQECVWHPTTDASS